MIRNWLSVLVLILACHVAVPTRTKADEIEEHVPSALQAMNDIGWAQVTVQVLDPEGKPVLGARICPWALRAGNAHGRWDEESYGKPRPAFTDQLGQAVIDYPRFVHWHGRVAAVSVSTSHPEYCSQNSHLNVPNVNAAAPKVTLQSGYKLRIAGVAPGSDRPLPHCHVMVENTDVGEPQFVTGSDGWMRSVPLRSDQRWYRVIYAPPDAPVQFSKPRAWDPEDPDSLQAQVEVHPGVVVKGMVSDSVPRPIHHGHVSVWCGSPIKSKPDANAGRSRSIWWLDSVPIREDGSFEFTSLPSGYLAQFFALANDSISSPPTDEAYATCCQWFSAEKQQRNDFFRYGQIKRLSGGPTELTLEMEPACQARIKCVDPNGNPLRQIQVSSWPNQFIVGGGSTIFCSRHSSRKGLTETERFDWNSINPYSVRTNAEGEAVIHNLPQGSQPFIAGHDLWKMRDHHSAKVDPDNVTEITLTLTRVTDPRADP